MSHLLFGLGGLVAQWKGGGGLFTIGIADEGRPRRCRALRHRTAKYKVVTPGLHLISLIGDV